MARVVLLGTCDTKLQELLFLRDRIQDDERVKVILIDVGRRDMQDPAIHMTRAELVSRYGGGRNTEDLSRGELIKFMAACASGAVRELYHDSGSDGSFDGIIAAGGSGGTALASAAMRDELPIGFPKLIVSTVASRDTGPIVGESDITMMYSVVDVAGLNQVLRDILSNAGAATAAAALSYAGRRRRRQEEDKTAGAAEKKRVGITMFGVTTPGVDAIRAHLEANYPIETYVFHATGHGGGAMSAGPARLEAAAQAGIPNIVSLGALDMSNFGPRNTVPEKYRVGATNRKLYEHNSVVTLMRTSEDESRRVGEFICAKLRAARDPSMVEVWIPLGGVSMIAKAGGAFEDARADAVLFDTIRVGLRDGVPAGGGIRVVEDPRDINDEGFARDIAEALVAKMGLRKG